jgi:alanine racemase
MSGAADLRPTWAEVDLGAFERNLDAVRRLLPSDARLVAVLKADGYGHGAVELARRCTPERVAMLAVALLEEAIELRQAGIELPLLVLGPLTGPQIVRALEERITMGVIGPEELEGVCAVARERDVVIHLKLDSGMGRMGITEGELPRTIELIRSAPRLRIEAVYTHFAVADEPDNGYTEQQIANYDRMVAMLREAGIDPPGHHFANSPATVRGLVRPGDLARVGIALYGPGPSIPQTEPVLRWRTEVARLKELPAGHPVGYGMTWRAPRPSRIATLPVGYADGYRRALSNRGEVLVRGRRVPVVGRVSMDLVTIDVTDVAGAAVGDEVVLLGAQDGERITADEIAARIDTISYDVLTSISARVPRIYA